ncbi:prepilin peptidase [Jiella sp. CQZ9-1]|uniref:Prepilin peptidase n=1 Tax=Jiella flava TaxID=2816857 RepID=A0A939FY82_9HYPH|nr:prepilin peptidase [Jiella flava]
MTTALLLTVFPFAMIFSAMTDLLEMKIENWAMVVLALAFLPAAFLVGLSWQVLGLHILVGFMCLSATFGMFAAGWMGGGDAKLIAATALWFGPSMMVVEYLLMGALFGGVLTLLILTLRGKLLPATGFAFVDRLMEQKTGIPYGVALGVAGLYVYSHSFWMTAAVG